ncbi:GPW/gp25 family protein [Mucilaginibacter sp. AW1-3]
MPEDIQSFLGTGWAFPPTFTKSPEMVRMVSDEKDIEQSLHIILNTTPGERIMQPEFGCDLKRLAFEINDSTLIANFNHIIYHALLNFEPRVTFIEAIIVNRDELDGVLHIQVDYKIIITNTRHNIVFPFYLQGEGTNVSV